MKQLKRRRIIHLRLTQSSHLAPETGKDKMENRGKEQEEDREGGLGGGAEECERDGLVTFNLVALHIAILHFTYDGDTSDNNRQK